MEFSEIQNLYTRLDERATQRATQNIDSSQDDNHLASMADTAGWEALKGIIESMIAELLVPPEFADTTPMDVRGAVNEARRFGVEVARKIISQVETTKAAKISEKLDATPEEPIV
jgi:hypothetical protein